MALVIVGILIFAFLLIATESLTNVNKAAVAIFAGTVGWMLYICYGYDFVMSQYPVEFASFLHGATATSTAVKEFIAEYVFLKYVGRAAEIVLFLLATMTIVEILGNNGCFDFISQLLKTRRSQRMLWILSVVTFMISANLDNITTAVMMLVIMRKIIPNRRHRLLYGSVIVLAANCGGSLTVIGDPNGLVLWNKGSVTATAFSVSMLVPCLIAWLVPTWWIGRSLPEHVDTEWITMPYRGDDTRLNVWQRLLMLFVGIGGLWFIPTFHNITKLSPFLGALCVLAVLWIVDEIANRRVMNADVMLLRRNPRILQHGVIQLMLFVMGMMLAVGVVQETGAVSWLWEQISIRVSDIWILGALAGLVSTVLDNFATALTFFTLNPSTSVNDPYWTMIAYATMAGGNVMSIGSISGMALMRAEKMRAGWYFRHVGWMAMVGGIIGFIVLFVQQYIIQGYKGF